MTFWRTRSEKKPTGGLLNRNRKKRKSDRGLEFVETSIGKKRVIAVKKMGGGLKTKLKLIETVNVHGKGTVKILSVTKNDANPQFVRRNIITKGAILKTDIGLVKVTSRPAQDGVVNGVLVEKK